MTRKIALSLLTLFLALTVCVSAQAGSHPLSLSQMSDLQGSSWCGFFEGFSGALVAGGTFLFFVPGAQGAALVARISGAAIGLGVLAAC